MMVWWYFWSMFFKWHRSLFQIVQFSVLSNCLILSNFSINFVHFSGLSNLSILSNFQFCPTFNFQLSNFQFRPTFNFVQFSISVQFSILSNFQFCPNFQFVQFWPILSFVQLFFHYSLINVFSRLKSNWMKKSMFIAKTFLDK